MDQGVVSGTSFLSVLLIARWSGASELGVYALGSSLVFSLVACQDSLILEPYLIQRYYPQGTPAERASASFVLSLLFSAVSGLALVAAALACRRSGSGSEIVTMLWAISAVSPFALTRNFARRFYFAGLEFGSALVLDATIAVIQLASFQWLGANGRLSAVNAFVALGATYAIVAAGWLVCMKKILAVQLSYLRSVLQQTWALGKWLLAGQLTLQATGNLTYWLSMSLLGATVTGVLAACMSVVGFVNPLLHGLRNAMMPKLVLAWKNGGGPSLWEEAVHNAKLIASLMGPTSLGVAVAGEPIMRILYHGSEFAGHRHTLTVLALASVVASLGVPASAALATMVRPRAIVAVSTAGAFVDVALVWGLMTEWGLAGAAYGLLGGNVFGAVARWLALHVSVSRSLPGFCDPGAAQLALQDFTQSQVDNRWNVTRLGGGDDAETFLTQREGPPINGIKESLVVKIYKPKGVVTLESAQAGFNSLSRLHAALDGRKINEWAISVPRPLHICQSPLALLMTHVAGKHIEALASTSQSTKIIVEAAQTCAMAIQSYWSAGERHGDFGLPNILFDPERHLMSFIDTGTIDTCRICNECTNESVPEREIAHLLCSVTMDLSGLFARSGVRTINETFMQNFLLTILESIDTPEEKRRLLNEIWFWAQIHMHPYIDRSWSLRAAWFKFVREIATYRIRWMLKRAEQQSETPTEQDFDNFVTAIQTTQSR
jgi:O-antigen/teichoic acid export membrane protein